MTTLELLSPSPPPLPPPIALACEWEGDRRRAVGEFLRAVSGPGG